MRRFLRQPPCCTGFSALRHTCALACSWYDLPVASATLDMSAHYSSGLAAAHRTPNYWPHWRSGDVEDGVFGKAFITVSTGCNTSRFVHGRIHTSTRRFLSVFQEPQSKELVDN